MVMIFSIAGTAKLRASGLHWAFSDNMRNTFLTEYYLNHPLLGWGYWIAQHHWLCVGLGLMTLIAETFAPLALFSTAAAWLFIPALLTMQIGNELVLGINFRQFILCYAFWVDWRRVGMFARTVINNSRFAPMPMSVMFDGSCGLCQRTVAVIRRVDLLQRVEVLDALNDWPHVSRRFPKLDQMKCMELMHVVSANGKVTTGFFGYRTLCWAIPLGWLMLPFLYIPGVPAIGQRVYEHIADGRFRHGCGVDISPDKPAVLPGNFASVRS